MLITDISLTFTIRSPFHAKELQIRYFFFIKIQFSSAALPLTITEM